MDLFQSIIENKLHKRSLSENGQYLLGIDGGGTKTEFALCDVNGKLLKRLEFGPSNPCDIGMEKTQALLKEGIAEISQNILLENVFLHAGLAGGGTGENTKILTNFLKQFGFAGFECGSDIDNVLYAGLSDSDGISVIMGTGFCVYRQMRGVRERFAGWGYLFDEFGSAYNIARDALSEYFFQKDGRKPRTILAQLIEEFDTGDASTFVPRLYEGGKSYISTFAKLVFTAADANDTCAKNIIDKNIRGVADTIETVAKPMMKNNQRIKVVIAGGLTNQERLIPMLYDSIHQPEQFDITKLANKPVYGAVEMAKKHYLEAGR